MASAAVFGNLMHTYGLVVNAVTFDGTNDYANKTSDLSGNADGKAGTFSVWVKLNGGDGADQNILTSESSFFVARRILTNVFNIQVADTGGTFRMIMSSSATYVAGSGWHNVLASWDVNATTGALYIDNVSALGSSTFTNATLDYTRTSWYIGANQTPANFMNATIAELFFHPTYIDITVLANRRKFIDSNNRPVSLGSNGSTPLGVQPLLYMKGNAAGYLTNSGSGGNFTTLNGGGLVDSTSYPHGTGS